MLTNINYGMPSQSNVNPDSINNASEFEIYAEPSIIKEDAVRIRKKCNLSQRKFAKAIGASLASVRKWEQGVSPICNTTVTLYYLLDRKPELIFCLYCPNQYIYNHIYNKEGN